MEAPINNAKDIVERNLKVFTTKEIYGYVKVNLINQNEAEWTKVANSMVSINTGEKEMETFTIDNVFKARTHVLISKYLQSIVYSYGN